MNKQGNGFLGLVILVIAVIPWGTVYMLEQAIEEGGLWGAEDTWQYDVAEFGADFMDSQVGDIVYEIPVDFTEDVITDDTTVKEAMAIVGVFTYIEGIVVLGILYALAAIFFGRLNQDSTPAPSQQSPPPPQQPQQPRETESDSWNMPDRFK